MHVGLATVGFTVWAAGILFMYLSTMLSVLGDRVLPGATSGNCWSFALPKWHKHGGYLLIRDADGQRFLNLFKVPHVIWVKTLPPKGSTIDLEQFVPVKRKVARWLPLHTVYYEGRTRTTEVPHNSRPAPLNDGDIYGDESN